MVSVCQPPCSPVLAPDDLSFPLQLQAPRGGEVEDVEVSERNLTVSLSAEPLGAFGDCSVLILKNLKIILQ